MAHRREERRSSVEIGAGRKGLYYTGMALVVLGIGLFVVGFVTFAKRGQDAVRTFGRSPDPVEGWWTGLVGMGVIVVGGVLMNIGRRGAAGSGLVLDPKRAREDLAPWSRMAGGMADDAIEETRVGRALAERLESPSGGAPLVKVKCRACGALSDEDAKFCDQCGKPL